MNQTRFGFHWYRRLATFILALAVVATSAYLVPSTQAQGPAKKVLTIDDYTRWRSISGQEISGDGKWVAYGLSSMNTLPADAKPVLHILGVETNQDVPVQDATGASFSPDSRWIAYHVDPGGGRGGRGRGGTPPSDATPPGGGDTQPGNQARGASGAPTTPPRRVELRNLATGAVVGSWQDIESFAFNANSTHLFLRHRASNAGGATAAPGATGGRAAAGAETTPPTGPRGVEVVLVNLATERWQLLGMVGDIAFNKSGELLAYTVDATAKDANGLFVLDLKNDRQIGLDNDAKLYNRLTWSEDGTALAVLKGLDVDKMRERANVLLAFPNVQSAISSSLPGAPVSLDPSKTEGFPKSWVVSDRATLSWSDDKKRVFFGAKEQVAAPPTGQRKGTDEVANVDIWTSFDERVQSLQMMRADQDRNFTFRQAFDVSAVKFVRLADDTMRDLDVAVDGRWAVGRDTRGYISDYKPAAADIYRVNTSTGERTLMLKGHQIGSGVFGISTDGHYYLYWKDLKIQAYDLDGGTTRTLAATSAASFVDPDYDHPGPKPSLGIAGYTSDNRSVIVNQKHDLWQVPLDGSAPRNLTNGLGTKNEVRFRYVRTEREPGAPAGPGGPGGGGGRGGGAGVQRWTIDLSKPVLLSAFGEWTKKAGFYELANGQMKELVFDDASFSSPVKAAKADKYLFTRETFAECPDLRVSGLDFKDIKKISDANPQQAEYLWGHRILFEFKNRDGLRLQGILGLPDDYRPGEKRPMMVNFYEKNSQNLNRYTAPSYLTGFGSSPIQAISEGYITMLPDIHFRTGASHTDMLECVEAATRRVIEMGYADPKHIGINGHSYGGEGTALIGVRSKLFAAAADGSGVTDLFFDFNINWGWQYQVMTGSGQNQMQYYLDGQAREGVSPWQNPQMYADESALYHVPESTTPFLLYHGTADSTVSFNNGMAFYNALRFNNKSVILLAYPNEGHGLTGLANRKDLTIRFFQFFNHYLKSAPAPEWMTKGVTYLQKEANRDTPAIK